MKKLTDNDIANRTLLAHYLPKKEKPIFNNEELMKLVDKGEITPAQYKFFELKEEKDKSFLTGKEEIHYWPRILATYHITKFRHIDFTGFRSIPFFEAKKFVRNTIPYEDCFEKVNFNSLDLSSGRFFLECRYSKNPYAKRAVMKKVTSVDELSSIFEDYINDKYGMISHTMSLKELEGIKLK